AAVVGRDAPAGGRDLRGRRRPLRDRRPRSQATPRVLVHRERRHRARRHRRRADVRGHLDGRARPAGAGGGALPRREPRRVQEPALHGRRRRPARHGHTRHGSARRADQAPAAHEAPVTMRVAMVATAVACAALALGASSIVPALAVVAATLVPAPPPVTLGAWLTLEVSGEFASLSMPAVALALAGGILLPVLLLAVARVRPRPRRYETWACGRVLQTARMEYTATAFADPFTRVFDFFYR